MIGAVRHEVESNTCSKTPQQYSLARAALDELLSAPPSGFVLDGLMRLDPVELPMSYRADCLAALARIKSVVAAQEAAVVAAMSRVESLGKFDGVDLLNPGREEVMTTLHISAHAAQSLMARSRDLVDRCPATLERLKAGVISEAVAKALVDEVAGLSNEQIAQVEGAVLPRAGTQTPADARRSVRRAVAKVAPEFQKKRCTQEVRQRFVRLVPASYGMAFLDAYLPAAQAMSIFSRLDQQARHARKVDQAIDGDSGSAEIDGIDAYRADAFMDYFTRTPGTATTCSETGSQVNVVIDLATLLGLDNEPGELRGHGPIPAELARALAKDAKWQRWITEPTTGHLLELGRTRYVPNAALRDYICARDGVCRFPGCNQPAHRNDIDHAQPWEQNGRTDPDNLGSLCRRHHRLKTHGKWQITESHADGTCVWRSPTGRRITSEQSPPLEPPLFAQVE